MKRIPVAGPSVTEKEIAYVTDAARTGWYETAGVYIDKFERQFARAVGVKHAISLPSCTSAIHLSLAALGVQPGDEVIVPDATWIASAAPISYLGATPVFADVDPVTWCLTTASVAECLSPKTKAVIAVDLYGSMPIDLEETRRMLADRGVALIEDAAEGLGSTLNGRAAGSFGDTGVFSFHGSKTVTTGEGGMLVTDRDDLLARVKILRDHGRVPGDKLFWNGEVGYKYKMSALQAAFGLGQVERWDELISMKRRLFGWYREELGQLKWLTLNAEPAGVRNSFWMVTAVLDESLGLEKEELIARLSDRGIDSRPFFYPLSSLPAYAASADRARAQSRNVVSRRLGKYGLNLPSALSLSREDVGVVGEALREIVGRR